MTDDKLPDTFQFLRGGGNLGALIAAFDWGRTSVGHVPQWPAYMKVATSLMLRSKVPIVMLWGEAGVMVYNDAYAVFAGERHPHLLGSNVREGWPEVAEFNDHVMAVGLAGGTLNYQDQELTLHRHGRPEQVWMNLDYSPLADERGQPVGVMALVVETTGKVQAQRSLRSERESFARLFEQAPSFMALLAGPEHRIELANPNYLKLVGHRKLVGLTIAQALPDAAAQGYVALLDAVYASGVAYTAYAAKYAVQVTPGGPIVDRYVDFVFQPIVGASGEVTGIFVEGIDVTPRIASERRTVALSRLSESFLGLTSEAELGFVASQLLGEMLNVSRVGFGTIDPVEETLHVVRDWTAPGVQSLAGVVKLREYGSFIDSLKRDEFIHIADVRLDARTRDASDALEGRSARSFVNVPVVERGELVAVLYVNHASVSDWSADDLAFIREVARRTRGAIERNRVDTALRQSEAALREANETLEAKVERRTHELIEVEAKFRQSQKMEAIGQLTGGIAHDFNNLLAGISSTLQVLQRRLNEGKADDAERYIGIGRDAVRRAAALTHRLLAFSRRQTLDPKPTDVNRLISGLEEMIRRTVGPSVSVEVVGAGGLWVTRVDGPQLENALLNLCINGRDAMLPDGGRLTLETANRWLDDRAAAERDLPAGQYISICVTDTGTGMTPDVASRAFDPFFTTKPTGLGTGLGLSMVYGFVRQSGGQVRIYSELGTGTTMCMYLPRFLGEASELVVANDASADEAAHGESVLLIEDEEAIRTLVAEELRELGYRVLTAVDGPSGLVILRSATRIDLLMTDVGLPGGLNGRQVADAARETRPQLKVLFITGYAENAAVGNGLLEHGMEVITKPFDLAVLANKIRGILER
jgi:signal transduction histidine kinase/CheY-like chemotaxis protein/PAS domain-containing protein